MKEAANFDRIAGAYQVMEYLTLGPLLERTRMHFLPSLRDRRKALLLGDGDGRFLARLLLQNETLQADAVDSSGTMLAEARRRSAAMAANTNQRLRTHRQDALKFVSDRHYDLVVTHFFFDCLTGEELAQFVTQTAPRLASGALWLVSEFRIPERGFGRWIAHLLVRSLYGIFRVLTGLRVTSLPEHATALRGAGLVCLCQHGLLFGLLTTELWKLSESPDAGNG